MSLAQAEADVAAARAALLPARDALTMATRLGAPARFGIVDLSLAPTPAIGDSVAEILEAFGMDLDTPGTC